MTADNTKWNYGKLCQGIKYIELELKAFASLRGFSSSQIEALRHTLKFIEYNMREMEISDDNGD